MNSWKENDLRDSRSGEPVEFSEKQVEDLKSTQPMRPNTVPPSLEVRAFQQAPLRARARPCCREDLRYFRLWKHTNRPQTCFLPLSFPEVPILSPKLSREPELSACDGG